MKTLYTSYFARAHYHARQIAICALLPSWVRNERGFDGEHRPEFGPSWELVKHVKDGKIDHEQFADQYIKELKERGWTPQSIVDRLPNDSVLICYERPDDFCHRHVLAEWLQQHADVQIHEILTHEEQQQIEQQRLVDQLIQW